jgi:hypothetical protein
LARVFKALTHYSFQRSELKAKASKMPTKKPLPLEEDERIVAGTLQGERECKMGLGKKFDKLEDAIAYLRDL